MGMKNFCLSQRKADLKDFNILPPDQDLSWIETNIGAAGAPVTEVPVGTKNGSNAVFTVSSASFLVHMVVLNGRVLHEDQGDYTLVGTTLTMAVAPQSDDTLVFWGWTA